ncbi:MAG: alpha-1,2-fucosyltransferase [Gammaproteobacteria bacterium]|nr:alpha-1,2-fucosyltransferase [Gammaproteobacteria bacterium]
MQDLYLMTQCRSFILSNSSLHWWAAWLAATPPHTVIASQKGWPNDDMLPAHWLRLA